MVGRVTRGGAAAPQPEERIPKKLQTSKEHVQKAVADVILEKEEAKFSATRGLIGPDLSKIREEFFS